MKLNPRPQPGDQRRRVLVVEGHQAAAHASEAGPDHLGVVTCAWGVPDNDNKYSRVSRK